MTENFNHLFLAELTRRGSRMDKGMNIKELVKGLSENRKFEIVVVTRKGSSTGD